MQIFCKSDSVMKQSWSLTVNIVCKAEYRRDVKRRHYVGVKGVEKYVNIIISRKTIYYILY